MATLKTQIVDGIAQVELNRPEVRNAINLEMARELTALLESLAPRAKVGLPETSLGIFPGAGGTWRLPRLVGLGRAKELVFTGRILTGEEAHALGLFERLCEPGQAVHCALELAKEVVNNAPLALRVAKIALNSAAKGSETSSLERLGQGLLFDSTEKRERMTAFLEKRGKKGSGRG